jgi:glyoxylase-like metal-dependent hydrolase (beta-lactamase superfamily II)
MSHPREVPEVTCEALIRRVEAGEPIRVLDIRANTGSGRIDIVPDDRYQNIRGSQLAALGRGIPSTVPQADPVAVVCDQGNSSQQIAMFLNRLGYRAESVRGGMAAWGMAVATRRLAPPAGFDHFLQFDRVAKGGLGYLLAAGGEGIVIDPPRRTDAFLGAARDLGVKVVAVADTHAHADYISGGPALSSALGIPYYLHPRDAVLPYDGSPATVPFTPADEGIEIPVGGSALRVVHTPGHTEGSACFLAGDAAMTGDFIFVNSIGRPDLGGKAEAWTKDLWKSLERARREWPAETRLFPAHYAGASERESDRSVGRAFGAIQAKNEPLRFTDEAAFTAWVMKKVGRSPDAYRRIKAVNLGLLQVWEQEAQELDCGKNECALG